MKYDKDPMELSDPSWKTRTIGLILMLLMIGVIGHLVNMTFFYVPEPNETPLEGWDLFLGWALGLLVAFGAGFIGLGAWLVGGQGGAHLSKDPKTRITSINGGDVPNEALIRIAMTDPEADVRMAAVKAAPFKELVAAYKYSRDYGGFECPELAQHVVERRKKAILKQAETLEGFKKLQRSQLYSAVDLLPKKTLFNYFRQLDNKTQKQIVDRIHDKEFLREVAVSNNYSDAVRLIAISTLGDQREYEVLLKSSSVALRKEAINNLSNFSEILLAHLPNETDEVLSLTIVDEIGWWTALEALQSNPTPTSAKAIVSYGSDLDRLKKIAAGPGLNEAAANAVNTRIAQIEKHQEEEERKLAEARKRKKQAAERRKADIATKAKSFGGNEGEAAMFATIENQREDRVVRLAATTAISALRPENKIVIQDGLAPAWHCPNCAEDGDACMKPAGWEATASQLEQGAFISGSVTCPKCGTSYPMKEIISGKYDVIMVNIDCPHCANPMAGPIDSWINCECMSCGKIVLER